MAVSVFARGEVWCMLVSGDSTVVVGLQVLQPGIELAEQGFPLSPVTAYHWDNCSGEQALMVVQCMQTCCTLSRAQPSGDHCCDASMLLFMKASCWMHGADQLRGPGRAAFLNPEGRAPRVGEVHQEPRAGRHLPQRGGARRSRGSVPCTPDSTLSPERSCSCFGVQKNQCL